MSLFCRIRTKPTFLQGKKKNTKLRSKYICSLVEIKEMSQFEYSNSTSTHTYWPMDRLMSCLGLLSRCMPGHFFTHPPLWLNSILTALSVKVFIQIYLSNKVCLMNFWCQYRQLLCTNLFMSLEMRPWTKVVVTADQYSLCVLEKIMQIFFVSAICAPPTLSQTCSKTFPKSPLPEQ